MGDNYAGIVRDNLERIFQTSDAADRLSKCLPGERLPEGRAAFPAFGEICRIGPDGIFLGDEKQEGPRGIVLSLYAANARDIPCAVAPLKAFKDFPGSMPYVGAFATHTQNILVDPVERIRERRAEIMERMDGRDLPADAGGDFSFLVFPLPKIALAYIFYEADEDFPASATCLFSSNADEFLSMDGLADLGEYTSRAILKMVA